MERESLTENLKVRLPRAWKRDLKKLAAKENLELSDIVRRAISQLLDKELAEAAK